MIAVANRFFLRPLPNKSQILNGKGRDRAVEASAGGLPIWRNNSIIYRSSMLV